MALQQKLWVYFLLLTVGSMAQTTDSAYHQLQEVEIRPLSQETQLRLLSSEVNITASDLEKQANYSLVPALNTVPGVRMEERSPGSYRLSIRGSLLRSPFGVRNVKIYLGDFMFTDAGGNTYLNSLDAGNLNGLHIIKGPEASLFGANTGGVLLIDPVYKTGDSLKVIASASGGSYGLFHQDFLIQQRRKRSLFTLSQGYQRADGYRQNSGMQRNYVQLSETWSYLPKAQLRVLTLFSDMAYQTPGGLTLQQFEADPQQARPATPAVPSAVQQKAAVYNRTLFGGMANSVNITSRLKHVIAVMGSHTDFKNPFITNYEQRSENTLGARTYIDLDLSRANNFTAKWNLGGEWQQTNASIYNYGNTAGSKDTVQAADLLNALQAFAFTRFLIDVKQKLLVEASLSYNVFRYDYRNEFPLNQSSMNRKHFDPQLMPRLALSYKITANMSWRASASRGYSSPTLAEVRSSNNIVNTALQAESGWSYETGIRLRDNNDRLWLDVAGFYYQLQNAIVRRLDDNGNEYFINAGGTSQPGLEAQLALWLLKPRGDRFLRSVQIKANLTYNQFTFSNYQASGNDYSGHALTGVPKYTSVESLYLELPYHISLFGQYYYSAAIPLNDANIVDAKAYHLVQTKVSWKKELPRFTLTLFAGIDNVLNATYSLGNDLNAVGGRYYNSAPPRNYYGGLRVEF